ncbi:MAG TPA: hypothetical protein VEH06_07105 [Candidatus Bathyarchaeia archaeon]|nr:hypothetical protein [Candidatus Bathyarchaeia archaeon]
MIILLSAVNEGIGAAFVGAFEDDKISQILELPKYVRPVGIICLILQRHLKSYPELI